MVWIVLVASAFLEAVWANALGASDGFTKLLPSLVFVAAVIPGMVSLAWVAKRMPISTAYALWAGLGAAFTVLWAMLAGTEPVTVLKVLMLTGIVGSVVGLKLLTPVTTTSAKSEESSAESEETSAATAP